MEIVGFLLIIFLIVIFLKVMAFVVHTGIFLISLPLKILAVTLGLILILSLLVPFGIIGSVAAILAAPFVLLAMILPILLIFVGIYLLVHRS